MTPDDVAAIKLAGWCSEEQIEALCDALEQAWDANAARYHDHNCTKVQDGLIEMRKRTEEALYEEIEAHIETRKALVRVRALCDYPVHVLGSKHAYVLLRELRAAIEGDSQ